jgi:methionine-rich copper-binding protein CopC
MMRCLPLLMLALLTTTPPALAHAFLERALPPVGSTVDGAPKQIVLTFTEGVEPLFSTIELRDAHGSSIAAGKPRTPSNNDRQLVVDLPALSSGGYTVIWHATSVDTHKTEGSYQFTVR